MTIREAALVLADGTTFEGEAMGAEPPGGIAAGEVVFNTVLTGYQEVISDPSYAGQIITFTNPHIGNYGVNPTDDESRRPFCRGVIVRELSRRRSNWRSDGDLNGYLRRHGVPGIGAIDTRRLTRHIRDAGAMPGAFGTADEVTLKEAALVASGTDGCNLAAEVTTAEAYTVAAAPKPGLDHAPWRVTAYDPGIKTTIRMGADYLVVGRPITGHSDPRLAAQMVIDEIDAALDDLADVKDAKRPSGEYRHAMS